MKTKLAILTMCIFALSTFAKTNPNDSLTTNIDNTFSKNIISYKIQIGAFYSPNYDSNLLNSLCCELFVEDNKANKKFLIGNYYNLKQAKYALDVVQKKIVSDAFIVPYINNKRVSFNEVK